METTSSLATHSSLQEKGTTHSFLTIKKEEIVSKEKSLFFFFAFGFRARWVMKNTIVVMAIVIVAVVVVGLIAYGVWLMWKRKQASNPYIHVDEAIVAEQELLPL